MSGITRIPLFLERKNKHKQPIKTVFEMSSLKKAIFLAILIGSIAKLTLTQTDKRFLSINLLLDFLFKGGILHERLSRKN